MPRKPDVPCAGCGRLIWWGSGSLPAGEAMCQPCRRVRAGRGPDEKKPASRTWTPEPRVCPICTTAFTQERYGQVYCSVSCRESRRNWSYATKTASAEERGYGKAHRQMRAKWKRIVDAGRADCCICGYWIEPGTKWHLDHTEDRTGYRGAAHAECNMRDGAKRGARKVNAQRPR